MVARNLFLQSAFFISLSGIVLAEDLGTFGEVFDIKERDILKVIEEKLQTNEIQEKLQILQSDLEQKTKSKIFAPKAVIGLSAATKPKEYYFDPSITLKADLKAPNGKLVYRKGEKINPLNDMPFFNKKLFFIDGENKKHKELVLDAIRKDNEKENIVILVKGAPIEFEKEIGITTYFDFDGKITSRLGIVAIPAIAEREGDRIKIREIVIGGVI